MGYGYFFGSQILSIIYVLVVIRLDRILVDRCAYINCRRIAIALCLDQHGWRVCYLDSWLWHRRESTLLTIRYLKEQVVAYIVHDERRALLVSRVCKDLAFFSQKLVRVRASLSWDSFRLLRDDWFSLRSQTLQQIEYDQICITLRCMRIHLSFLLQCINKRAEALLFAHWVALFGCEIL